MPARRWRGSDAPLPQAGPPPVVQRQRVRVLVVRRPRPVQLPLPQAAANTNQPAFVASPVRRRPAALLLRRTRAVTPLPPVELAQQPARPRLRAAGVRRLRRVEFPWPQAAANTNQPVLVASSPRQRLRAVLPRRPRRAEPPWPQAAASPNPAIVDLGHRVPRRWPWTRRGRAIEPPWGQAAANTNQPLLVLWSARRMRPWTWSRRRSGFVLVNGTELAPQPSVRRRISGPPRRVRPASPPFAAVDVPLQGVRRRSPWAMRRVRAVASPPPPAASIVPPVWLPIVIRKILGRWWPWSRRGKAPVVLPLTVAPVVVAGPGTVGAHDHLAATTGAHDRLASSVGAHDWEP